MKNGFGSFWLNSTTDIGAPRYRLEGEMEADVAIVGAGYTGLWTAYCLKRQSPSTRVVVIEKDRVGYGASGRNGGWLSGKSVGLRKELSKRPGGRRAVIDMEKAVQEAVAEITDIFDREGIEIDAAPSGWMQIACSDSQLARLENQVSTDRSWGLDENDIRLLSASETLERVNIPGVLGSTYSPYAVRVNPAKLVYGLAKLCSDLNVPIYENSHVDSIEGGCVRTSRGSVSAATVVLATEGFTAKMPGMKRDLLPMRSSMVVSKPLDDAAWNQIGWSNAECVSGAQHMYFYSQRTPDGRIAIGGRGVPYKFGSRLDANGRLDSKTQAQLMGTLRSLFPQIELDFDHSWCGVLGVTRDWSPFVDMDSSKQLVRVGGYAGQGVTAAYLAGQTVADLLLDKETKLSSSVWVRPLPRKWEPEPLRWIGANAIYSMYRLADKAEDARGGVNTSIFGTIGNRLAGR